MYKVFVNDKPIILTSSPIKDEDFPVFRFHNISFDEILYRLKQTDLEGIYIFSSNLENDWRLFCNNFKVVTAGGGLVLNTNKEVLFIYRANKWDLPKGRIEKGESIEETAVREVEEECGISNLSIEKFLLKTYHVFYQDNDICLKETYWYLMNTDYKGELVPQEEEGITEVVFKEEALIQEAFLNTYANIQLVYNCYLDSLKTA